jgi:hypothetical protein
MSLFPEMDQEIRDDRRAARREEVQRARDFLRNRDLRPVVNYLLEHGPSTEHTIMISEEFGCDLESCASILSTLHSLWLVGKLWRESVGIHPGSGQMSYRYGIKRVHQKDSNVSPNVHQNGGGK